MIYYDLSSHFGRHLKACDSCKISRSPSLPAPPFLDTTSHVLACFGANTWCFLGVGCESSASYHSVLVVKWSTEFLSKLRPDLSTASRSSASDASGPYVLFWSPESQFSHELNYIHFSQSEQFSPKRQRQHADVR